MLRQRFLWHSAVLLALAGPLHGETDHDIGARCGNGLSTSTATVARQPFPSARLGFVVGAVYGAIERGDQIILDRLLTDDFRFTSNDPEFMASFPQGFNRDDELNFLTRLEEAGHRARISRGSILVDPSPSSFQNPLGTFLVRVKDATMSVLQGDAIMMSAGPSEHVFEVVCVSMPETNGRASRCRVRRWHEDASGILAAIADSADASTMVAAPPRTNEPQTLGLRVLSNGRRDGLALSIALPMAVPAQLEWFDITGRRVDSRELFGLTRGTHAIRVPAQLVNGVYWARLHQGTSMKTARVVVLR